MTASPCIRTCEKRNLYNNEEQGYVMRWLLVPVVVFALVLSSLPAQAHTLIEYEVHPYSCTIGAGFSCWNYSASDSGMQMRLVNYLGTKLSSALVRFKGDVCERKCILTVTGREGWKKTACSPGDFCTISYNNVSPIGSGEILGVFTFSDCDKKAGMTTSNFTIEYQTVDNARSNYVNGIIRMKTGFSSDPQPLRFHENLIFRIGIVAFLSILLVCFSRRIKTPFLRPSWWAVGCSLVFFLDFFIIISLLWYSHPNPYDMNIRYSLGQSLLKVLMLFLIYVFSLVFSTLVIGQKKKFNIIIGLSISALFFLLFFAYAVFKLHTPIQTLLTFFTLALR